MIVSRKKFGLLFSAVIAMSAGLLLIAEVGVPQRGLFTGQLSLDGQLIAPELNAIAPGFQVSTLSGQKLSLNDLRGKPVVVNFWATWCEPCRVEMPELQRFYDAHKVEGLRIIAVNIGETPQVVGKWARALGLTFDIGLDSTQSVGALYQLRGQPSTYIISPGGVITDIFYGPIPQNSLQDALTPYLSR